MYRIKSVQLILLEEKNTLRHFVYGVFKTEQLLTPPNKASHQENLIMTRNDKFTLCNYLLPFQSSILWREDSVCAGLVIKLVR